jgi:membrane-associated phospholipid phosphatase
VAVVSAAGVAVLYMAAVLTAPGQLLDASVMTAISTAADPVQQESARSILNALSPGSVLAGMLLVTGVAMTVKGPRAALSAVVTATGTIVAAQVLKALLVRPDLAATATINSLPSGHVAAVAGLAAAAAVGLGVERRPGSWLIGGLAVAMTGWATLALQWHRPSDVLAAALLAVGVAAGATSASRRRTYRAAQG